MCCGFLQLEILLFARPFFRYRLAGTARVAGAIPGASSVRSTWRRSRNQVTTRWYRRPCIFTFFTTSSPTADGRRWHPHAGGRPLPLRSREVRSRHPAGNPTVHPDPRNPTGNVWTAELLAMAVICERYGILIVPDEVHRDLVFGEGQRHVPMAMLDEAIARNTLVCSAPSKTFNVAGLSLRQHFHRQSTPPAGLLDAMRAQWGLPRQHHGHRCARGGLPPW